jgi:hypothetical protein
MIDAGFISIVYIGFIQGPQKLINGFGKAIHLGMIDGGFTVVSWDNQLKLRIADDGYRKIISVFMLFIFGDFQNFLSNVIYLASKCAQHGIWNQKYNSQCMPSQLIYRNTHQSHVLHRITALT